MDKEGSIINKRPTIFWILGVLVVGLLVVLVLVFTKGNTAKSNAEPLPTLPMETDPTSEILITVTEAPVDQLTPVPTAQETLAPTPAELSVGSTRISDIDNMEQVFVPAGEFLMGTNDVEAKRDIAGGRAYPEIPQFTYYLDDYWIDKYEVTNQQYHACMDAGICTEPHRVGSYTYPDYFTNPIYDNYPVVWVNWFQATAYCEWAGRRLPTEAEWEKAARGTDGRKYPWGNEPYSVDKANICDVNCTRTHSLAEYNDGFADLAPIGSFPAGVSPYGALDMAGNAWEWNSTEIRLYPYDAADGREDPGGIDVERGWRGSSWANGLWWLRSSTRYHARDSYSWYVLSFRCAADAK